MQPIHNGLPKEALYDGNAFQTVAVCLDSGKLATDACRRDARGIDRVVYVNVYPGDAPTETCDKHVMMNYCGTGGGVATDYCASYPDADVYSAGLVKLSEAEVQEIRDAASVGLNDAYLNAGGVYYTGGEGWHGFYNEYDNANGTPYIECPLHGSGAWEDPEDITEPDTGFGGVDEGFDFWPDGDG